LEEVVDALLGVGVAARKMKDRILKFCHNIIFLLGFI
jgi:hypothetical protein